MKQTGILIIIVLIVLAGHLCLGQTESGSISFTDLAKKFSTHSSDLLGFVTSLSGTEKQAAMGFQHVATEVSSECQVLWEECFILKIISNEKEKQVVQKIVMSRIKLTSEGIDSRIKLINGMLPLTKNTAVVVQANKLKDDLRGLKETLHTLSGWFANPEANIQEK